MTDDDQSKIDDEERRDRLPEAGPLFDRDRPYDGQAHTDSGDRGRLSLEISHKWFVPSVVVRSDRPLPVFFPRLTLRDIHDAILIGVLNAKERPSVEYTLEKWGHFLSREELEADPGLCLPLPPGRVETPTQLHEELEKDPDFSIEAAAQNAMVEIEKRLGIYPNVPEIDWSKTTVEEVIGEKNMVTPAEALDVPGRKHVTGDFDLPPNAGTWTHLDDETPCPSHYSSTPLTREGQLWWCTEHQQHVVRTPTPTDPDQEN